MRKSVIIAKTLTFLTIIALMTSSLILVPTGAESIVIKPGGLDHLVLDVPSKPIAGESFGVGIKVFDSNNNLITNYDQTGRDIQVSVSGSAKAVPAVLKASAFSAGSSSVRIEDTKAEEVKLVLYDSDIQNPLTTVSIRIYPNALDHFALEAPRTARAGERFKVQVTAQDRFGNTVTGAEKSDALKVQSVGSAQIKEVAFPDFVGGTSSITAVSETTGTMYVEVILPDSAIKGRSGDIEISPADLDHFEVTAPSSAEAGKPFQIGITAYDRFNNLVNGYAVTGKGVDISSSGGAPVAPSYVSSGEFQGGSANVVLVYEKAGDIIVTATEKGSAQRGRSNSISVRPSGPDHFVVSTPEEATAGSAFRLKIEAFDRFGNLIKEYNRTGSDVHLQASGTGRLTPSVVAATEFVNGAATVDVNYDKAESITITATLAVAKATPQMPAEDTKKPVAPQPAPAKKTEPVKQTPPPQAMKPETKVARSVPPKEVVKEQKVFGVQDIKLIEAGPRALIVIKMPGLSGDLKYEDSIESIGGQDWIKLSLTPAEVEMDAQPTFESDIIGAVEFRENSGTVSADILIELRPKRVQYSVKRDEGSLVIDVLRLGVAR